MRRSVCAGQGSVVGIVLLLASGCVGLLNPLPPAPDEGGDVTPGGAIPARVSFKDPNSDFETIDVHDADGEIVQFDVATKAIVWAADGTSYQPGSWDAVDPYFEVTHFFQVRFGTEGGVRQAYFTETANPTICNISVVNGDISISATSVPVPQN